MPNQYTHFNILLENTSQYGFIGYTLNWVTSYLSGRGQYVRCKKASSKMLSVKIVLGLILFLLFANNLLLDLGKF